MGRVTAHPLIAVVDDHKSVRESLPDLLRELGYESVTFESAEQFLACASLADVACVMLDVAMPGMSGPELQRKLIQQGNTVPIVFITGRRDAGLRTALRRQGAVEVLFKPYSEEELRVALDLALPRP